jgi:hypothetical protein
LQAIPQFAAPSIDDGIIIRVVDSTDDARSESQSIRRGKRRQNVEHVPEGTELEQEYTSDQQTIYQPLEAVEEHQEEAEAQPKIGEEPKRQNLGHWRERNENEEHVDKSMAQSGGQWGAPRVETAAMGQEQTLKSVATPAASSIPQGTSQGPPTLISGPALSEIGSVMAGAEGVVASATLSPWDGHDSRFPNQRSASLPPPERPDVPYTGSPSRRHRRHQSELGSEQAHGVVSVISFQAGGLLPPMRLTPESRRNSLSTASSVSVGADWHGTILDMECESAEGGDRVFFQAKLDTAARRDAIAENIVKRVGMKWKPDPDGKTFKVIGDSADAGTVIRPLGYIMLKPRVVGRELDLKLKFYVLADSDVGRAFDCLLGCTTTMNHFLALKENVAQESLAEDPRMDDE